MYDYIYICFNICKAEVHYATVHYNFKLQLLTQPLTVSLFDNLSSILGSACYFLMNCG